MLTSGSVAQRREGSYGFKKKRLQNACDHCKRRKIRCDSSQMPGNICSHCRSFNNECTHTSSNAKKRKLTFINTTTTLSATNDPGLTLLDEFAFAKSQVSAILDAPSYQLPVHDDANTILQTLNEIAAYARSLEKALSSSKCNRCQCAQPLRPDAQSDIKKASVPEADNQSPPSPDTSVDDISDLLKTMELNDDFFGNSSSVQLAFTAKEFFTDQERASNLRNVPQPKELGMRDPYWKVYSWQRIPKPSQPDLIFPPSSLLSSLVNLYFTKHNNYAPLLHRPMFQRGIDAQLHKRDRAFGELVLSVCALGSKYSDDERVLVDDVDAPAREYSSGWKYIHQINPLQEVTMKNVLYVVQIICNMIPFLFTTSTPYECWSLLGLGIRHAQAIGAHRMKSINSKPTITQELWKRAFWVLFSLDTYMSVFSGRPSAVDDSEYDLDPPIECDDDYWEHPDPEQAFKQPIGRPSLIECWSSLLELLKILAKVQKNLYSVRPLPNLTPEHDVVVRLDSELMRWLNNIPNHLRWDMNEKDSLFLGQSALLYCMFYFVQAHLHRYFFLSFPGTLRSGIVGQQKQGPLSKFFISSLAVCVDAARSWLDIYSKQQAGAEVLPSNIPDFGLSHFLPHIVLVFLLINQVSSLYPSYLGGTNTSSSREKLDILQFLAISKSYEKRLLSAGRLIDMFDDLFGSPEVIEWQHSSGYRTRDEPRLQNQPSGNGRTSSALLPSSSAFPFNHATMAPPASHDELSMHEMRLLPTLLYHGNPSGNWSVPSNTSIDPNHNQDHSGSNFGPGSEPWLGLEYPSDALPAGEWNNWIPFENFLRNVNRDGSYR